MLSKEKKFTVAQFVGAATLMSAASGVGGAATVMAQDAVQDEKIRANTAEIEELRRSVTILADSTATLAATIKWLDRDLTEIKTNLTGIDRFLREENR